MRSLRSAPVILLAVLLGFGFLLDVGYELMFGQPARIEAEQSRAAADLLERLRPLVAASLAAGRAADAARALVAAANPRVRAIAAVANDGLILAAPDADWAGRSAAALVPGFDPKLAVQAALEDHPRVQVDADTRSLRAYFPLRPAEAPGDPLSADSGVLFLVLDLHAPGGQRLPVAPSQWLPWLVVMLLGAAVMRVLWRRRIERPLEALGAAADRLAGGGRGVRAEIKGTGEIADLAQRFDAMSREVDAARDALEEARHESEGRLGTLMIALPAAVYRCRAEGERRFERVSPNVETLAGYPAELFLREPAWRWTDLILPEDLAAVEAAIAAAVAARTEYSVRYRILDATGKVRLIRERGRAEYGEGGGPLWLDGVLLDVTREQATARALIRSQYRFQELAENVREVFWIFDWRRRRLIYLSPAFEALAGHPVETLLADFRRWTECVHPDDRAAAVAGLREVLRKGRAEDREYRVVRPHGEVRWVRERIYLIRGRRGCVRRIVGVAMDITERKRAEERLLQSEAQLRSILDALHEGVLLWDAEGNLRYANPGAERLFDGRLRDGNLVRYDEPGWGLQREDGEPLGSAEHPVARVLARAEPRIGDVYAVTAADGSKRWISFNAQPLLGSDGQTLMGAVTSCIDVTQLKTREHRLAHLAGHDPLTELPNRRLLAERLRQLTVQARRSGRRVAVCYLDLDGFKPVNDSLGHDAGDELLTEVAQRLLGQVREGDTVARVGGDEFALVLADLTEAQAVGSVLARLLEAISAPYVVAGTLRAGVSASIGVTVFPDDDAEPETLLRHADMAMFVAKQAGKGCYRLYDTTYGRRLSA